MKPSQAKAKGRETENSFVAFCHDWGLVNVERRRLKGAADEGDVSGWPGVVCEVKSGGKIDLPGWMRELRVEVENAAAEIGFLAIRPKGAPDPEDWWAALPLPWLFDLLAQVGWIPTIEDRKQ